MSGAKASKKPSVSIMAPKRSTSADFSDDLLSGSDDDGNGCSPEPAKKKQPGNANTAASASRPSKGGASGGAKTAVAAPARRAAPAVTPAVEPLDEDSDDSSSSPSGSMDIDIASTIQIVAQQMVSGIRVCGSHAKHACVQ